MKAIPYCSPKANYTAHKAEIDAAIHRVLESGRYILGSEVMEFEKEFAAFLSIPFAVGTASGTDALELALRACGVRPGDAIITVSHTAVATVSAIERAGAMPVFVDIDPSTYTMSPESLEALLKYPGNLKFRAVIPVHLYGHPADMPAILSLTDQYQLHVIEDCAQAHGASLKGKALGTWGHFGTFSFYPTKNVGAIGDGGAVVTRDKAHFEGLLALREYGWKDRYVSVGPGINSRLDEIQAAVLRIKLRYLEKENRCRMDIAEKYRLSLTGTSFQLPREIGDDIRHAYHLYVIRTKHRENVQAFLKKNGVGTSIHYPLPVHLQPAYHTRVPVCGKGLPHTESIYPEILSLPMFPELNDDQVAYVCDTLKRSCTS